MKWDNLNKESKDYVDRYIRGTSKTREQALEEKIVQCVIEEYTYGTNERLVFI